MKKFLIIILFFASVGVLCAEQVNWEYGLVGDNTTTPAIEISAKISRGFHLYAIDNPEGGAGALDIKFNMIGCKADGPITADKPYIKAYNDIFETDEHYYTGTVKFTQKLIPIDKNFSVNIEIQGQVCDDSGCYQVFDSHKLNGMGIVATSAPLVSENNLQNDDLSSQISSESNSAMSNEEVRDSLLSENSSFETIPYVNNAVVKKWWKNCEAEISAFNTDYEQHNQSLWYIFIAGFIGGLIALVTPCVWPMIPMTVSFFLKQNKQRKKSIAAAIIYGVSIIVIYVMLGILVTIIFGASALNELATSAGFNIAFFILLVIFSISFMGGFELTLPSSWSNKVDSKVDTTTGYLSIFFMAFTLALVSFSCTGPIIGTLLVQAAASSSYISPVVGMTGFALALALPFSLFAIFPTLLKTAPKSGGWMNTVKVVLGFLELALALKFLSVADLAYGWRILDREVFLSLWIVIFALLGVYLLGKITFPHDSKIEKIGITRFMLACVSLSFAVYMIPGLWGAPLKSISAFAPPISTQDFNLYEGSVHAQVDDFEEGMALSNKLNKPVLLDFSGYGCVNCRKMEAAVWTDAIVKSMIDNDFILVSLMVDDKTPLSNPLKVKEKDGKERTLYTYGDKWSYLQRIKFGANAQPYHIIVDKNATPLGPAFVYKEDIPEYLRFLQSGKDKFYDK